MLLGLLSDTHDKPDAAAAAVRLLQDAGAGFFIHCGDVGSTRILDYLAGLPAAFVWGNCDWDRPALERYAEKLGIQCLGSSGVLHLDGKTIGVFHGDDARLKRQWLTEQPYDYLVQGHSHIPEHRRVGRMLLVNPGALHRANPKTVALLDTDTGRVQSLVVATAGVS